MFELLQIIAELGDGVRFNLRSQRPQILPFRHTARLNIPLAANEPERFVVPMRALVIRDEFVGGGRMVNDGKMQDS